MKKPDLIKGNQKNIANTQNKQKQMALCVIYLFYYSFTVLLILNFCVVQKS